MSFEDYYTNVIPHMDLVSIVRLAQINKGYYYNFTHNKQLWSQVLAINHKIGINTKNLINEINLMYLYIDIITIQGKEKKYLNDIANGKTISHNYGIIIDILIPFMTNIKGKQENIDVKGNNIMIYYLNKVT